MCGSGTTRPDFSREEDQRRSDEAGAAENPEAIERAQQHGLLLNDPSRLSLGMDNGIGRRETACSKIAAQGLERFADRAAAKAWCAQPAPIGDTAFAVREEW